MGKTFKSGYLQNLIAYDASGNITLPGTLTINGNAVVATQSYVSTQLSSLVGSAPGALDTLNELSAALNNDANFSTTIVTSIATKEPAITAGTNLQYWRGDKTWQTLPIYTLSGLGGQAQLNGTGFVKVTGTTVSYDNSTYLTTSSASSTYLPLAGGTLTGGLTGTTANFSGNIQSQTLTIRNSGVPGIQVFRDLDVVSVGSAGQGIEFGARSGSTYIAAAAIYGGLDNPATTGNIVFQTLTAGTLTTKLTIASTGAATFTGVITANGIVSAAGFSITSGDALSANGNLILNTGANRHIQIGSATNYYWRIRAFNDDLEINGGANAFTAVKFFYPNGAATFSSSINATRFISNVTNSYGITLNRSAVNTYNGMVLQTAGNNQWFLGMRENLSLNNYIIYNEITATDAFTINISNNNVDFSNRVTANRFYGNYSASLNTHTTVNPSSNVLLMSPPNDRDGWIYLDQADTGSNWGIYHRQIDSAVGLLEGNAIGFIGGGNSSLKAAIGLSTGNGYFSGNLRSTSTGVDGNFSDAFVAVYNANSNETNSIQTAVSSNAAGSGFRFQVSNGGGVTTRTTVVDFLRDRTFIYNNARIVGTNNTLSFDTTGSGGSTTLGTVSDFTFKVTNNRGNGSAFYLGPYDVSIENGGITRMVVNASGHVTRPYQPAFLAYTSNISISAGTWQRISNSITTLSYDIGSNYSGGRFTAPVAGRYFFYFGGWSSISSNGERYGISITVNSGSYFLLTGGNYCITDSPLSGHTIVHNLNAGDYVEVHCFSAVAGTWGGGGHGVWWGGYLL